MLLERVWVGSLGGFVSFVNVPHYLLVYVTENLCHVTWFLNYWLVGVVPPGAFFDATHAVSSLR